MTVIYVYLDNKLIYSRGQDVTKRHGMYGNQLCTVELPKNVWGHTIKVVAKQMETDNSNHSTLFRIMKLKDAVDYPLANNSVFFMLYFIAIIVSLLIFISSLVLSVVKKRLMGKGIGIALITMSISLWQLGSRRQVYLITNLTRISANIEYFALFFARIPLFLYLLTAHKEKVIRMIYIFMEVLFIIFYSVCLICHFVFNYHIVNFEPVFYPLIFTALVVTFGGEIVSSVKYKNSNSRTIRNGLTVSATLSIMQIITMEYRIIFNKSIPKIFLNIDFATIAVQVFIITLFYSLEKSIFDGFTGLLEREQNQRLAYYDFLTRIPNRLYCTVALKELDSDKKNSYTVVFFDLDNLKYGNDKYCHEMGDKFPFEFHVSWGLCIKEKSDMKKSDEIIREADSKMYENKKNFKENKKSAYPTK